MSAPRHLAGPTSATAVAPLGTILSVWAHPDDETYLAGGLMAAASDLGQRVVCVSATAGEHGTSNPGTWPPERLGRVRRLEAAAAMAVLDVREHRFLGLPDGGLADADVDGIAAVEQLLDEIRPDTIVTFGPDGATFHPDHVAVHRWVTAVWRGRGRRERLLYSTVTESHLAEFAAFRDEWGVYMTDERPVGAAVEGLAVHLRLERLELDRKLTALRAMATQTGELLALVDLDTAGRLVAEEAFVEAW